MLITSPKPYNTNSRLETIFFRNKFDLVHGKVNTLQCILQRSEREPPGHLPNIMIIMYDMLTTAEHGEPSGPSAMFPATKDTENNERMGGGWPTTTGLSCHWLCIWSSCGN